MSVTHNLPVYAFSLGGMTPEFTMLALAAALGLFQLLIAARAGNGQRGLKWNVGARDEAAPPVGKVAARLERAARNFMETFPFFAVAVILCALNGRHSWATVWGAQIYVVARLIYLPLYGFGVPALRTLVWLVATLAIILLLVALFYPAL
ncbi:MAG: MAPEG family protein [Rhizomicrobium sp.]